jgi:CxxC motif-containing protein (DUF1111 family)
MLKMNNGTKLAVSSLALTASLALAAIPGVAFGQASGVSDPGVRAGTPPLLPLPGLNAFSTSDLTPAEKVAQGNFSINSAGNGEIEMFNAGANFFTETVSVLPPGTTITQNGATFSHIDDAPTGDVDGGGLGPSFNSNSCLSCHASPTVGGASGTINPQVKIATLDGATNTVPPFISSTGPIREARLITNGGVTDGAVHGLFTIQGRSDAVGCTATQINWPQQVANNNVIFRIPINTFGDGLVEFTSDEQYQNDAAAIASAASNNGISAGVFNHNGNTGTIAHFGWKAQNVSLLLFAGEAYNVEQGVTNDLFPNERRFENTNCQFNQLPEDSEVLLTGTPTTPSGFAFADLASDITQFAFFMRLSAPPAPAAQTAATSQGLTEFISVGCAECHIQSHSTGVQSIYTNQNFVTFSPFSDFAIHDMGTGLEDQVSQGQANGLQFRSAPLWGVGQRTFFLHDGRTSNIVTAIEDHKSSGSEANTVISNFNKLSATNQQDIVAFLRSL